MKQKIFITGVGGFLGSHIAEHFIKEGHEVGGCDNFIGGSLENVPEEVDFYQADCTNWLEMKSLVKDYDVVYHCAAIACEGLSLFSPATIVRNGSLVTATVLSAAIVEGVKRFVFMSSIARYGANKIPFTEDMVCNPQDPYGIGKHSDEKLVKTLCEVHNIEYVISCPHNLIGIRQKYNDPYRNVVSIMINRMLQGKQPIIYGDGEQKRCFSFVDDCIIALSKMATAKVSGETFNIGPDEEEEFITINELAKRIAKMLDFKLEPIYVGERPKEVKHATACADKARKILGYKTNIKLDEGLKIIIDWIKEKGTKPFIYDLPIEIEKGAPEVWTKELI